MKSKNADFAGDQCQSSQLCQGGGAAIGADSASAFPSNAPAADVPRLMVVILTVCFRLLLLLTARSPSVFTSRYKIHVLASRSFSVDS